MRERPRPHVGRDLLAVLNGNPRYVFWNRNGNEELATPTEKWDAVKYWQKRVRALRVRQARTDAAIKAAW